MNEWDKLLRTKDADRSDYWKKVLTGGDKVVKGDSVHARHKALNDTINREIGAKGPIGKYEGGKDYAEGLQREFMSYLDEQYKLASEGLDAKGLQEKYGAIDKFSVVEQFLKGTDLVKKRQDDYQKAVAGQGDDATDAHLKGLQYEAVRRMMTRSGGRQRAMSGGGVY